MNPVPPDLTIRYEWDSGSLPPPYHFEYTILVGPGNQGEIAYRPGYPTDQPPEWAEVFTVSESKLDQLHKFLLEGKIHTRRWQTLSEGFLGGSDANLSGTIDDEHFSIPGNLIPSDKALIAPLYLIIQNLVPPAIWKQMDDQRQKYVSERERNKSDQRI
jgi:hypothetical protein